MRLEQQRVAQHGPARHSGCGRNRSAGLIMVERAERHAEEIRALLIGQAAPLLPVPQLFLAKRPLFEGKLFEVDRFDEQVPFIVPPCDGCAVIGGVGRPERLGITKRRKHLVASCDASGEVNPGGGAGRPFQLDGGWPCHCYGTDARCRFQLALLSERETRVDAVPFGSNQFRLASAQVRICFRILGGTPAGENRKGGDFDQGLKSGEMT